MTEVRVPSREYVYAVSDSRRWQGFRHRPGDIFVCTPPKCGTTWMQTIVASLLWPDGSIPGRIFDTCPWLDARFAPIEAVLAHLESQEHRRAIKTHTPADGIPIFDTASYIVVGRNGLDAFMSWTNHIGNMREDRIAALNEKAAPDAVTPMRRFDGDIHEYFAQWLGEGALLNNIATWWSLHERENVLFVHYNDLKRDLASEMRRVASFIGVDVPDELWPEVVDRCTFERMRESADRIGDFDQLFEGGANTFLFKGTNGRWRDILTEAELDAYRARTAEMLPPDAAAWLEHGAAALNG